MSKKATPRTALAVQDGNVFEYLEKVQKKLKEVKQITDTPYKTPGRFTGSNGVTLDIKSEMNVDELVRGFSSIQARIKALDEGYETLGFTSHKLSQVDGGSLADWTADIKLRINIINNQEKLNKLSKIKDGLTSLMDNSQKASLLMSELENM